MPTDELRRLLQVVNERNLKYSRDDVEWAFDSPATKDDTQKWVREYLTPATLLTDEELNFHRSKAGKSGTEPSPTTRLSDDAFELAISSLESSTASIEKQCRLLEAQKRAIEAIITRNASHEDQKGSRALSSGRGTQEKAQLEFECVELSNSLQSRLDTSTKQAESQSSSIPGSIEKILEKDDRLLDGLDNILPYLSAGNVTSGSFEEVDRLCEALIGQSSADIRSLVDATYTAAIQQADAQPNGKLENRYLQDMQLQREALQAELDELCREIDGLSTMAVDSQYRNPISLALRTAEEDSAIEKRLWCDYVTSVMHYLTARLDAFNDHAQHSRAHNSALNSVSTALDGVVITSTDKKQTTRLEPQSPSKHSQKGLKPLRLVQANLSESQDPVVQLLKQLDVRVSDPANTAKLSEALSAAVTEQHDKLSAFSSTSERSLASQVAQSLAKVDGDAQALLGAVYSPSDFGTIRLLDKDIREGIEQLQKKTQIVGDDMRSLDMSEIAAALDEKQEAALQKLGEHRL